MAEVADYKSEILNAIRERFSDKLTQENTSDVISKCGQELDRMQSVEGLDGKFIIDKFYGIWKANKDKQGHENKVNSWTAYYLGITNKKPTGDFLPIRRAFARKGFPDIDSDFDYEFQGDIYDYIIAKYGEKYVANIGTYQTLQMKSLIKKMFKALDPDKMYADTAEGKERWKTECNLKADEIVKSLPKQIGAAIKVIGEDNEEHTIKTIEDAYKHCPDFRYYVNKYPDLLRHSKFFKGLVSGFGVHAAGIVISSDPLDSIAPLRTSKIKSGMKDSEGENEYVFASQYAYEDLESMGLIKFDILALTTLSVISRTVKMVKENYGIDIDVENMNLKDPDTFKLYRSGQLLGVFQCEKPGMQRTMRSLSPDRFEDIIAGVALYRPGPMDSVPLYSARKKGTEKVSYFHPSIEPFVKPFLETTYGVLTYQEQVMQICNSLAGFSIGDGYAVIKAVGKKVKSLLDKYKTTFIQGCVNNKVPKDIAEQYWEKFITPFASYGFNKSLLESTLIPTPDGIKQIKDFKKDDQVYAVDESGEIILTNVVDLHDHGILDGYEVTFDDGSTIICSGEHKFLTEYGQMPLMDIKRNCSTVLGIYQEQGEQHEGTGMGSEMWRENSCSEEHEETSGVLSVMSKVGLAQKNRWNCGDASVSVRNEMDNRERGQAAFCSLSAMYQGQGTEYIKTDGEVEPGQFGTESESNILGNSKKNFCKTGNTSGKSDGLAALERKVSRKTPRQYSESTSQPEAVEDGILDEIKVGMEERKNQVWRQAETGGPGERFRMDRSGRILSLLRGQKCEETQETDVDRQSRERCHAEQRGQKAQCHVVKNQHGVLQNIKRRDEGRLVEDISGHAPITNTGNLVSRKIVRIVPVGKRRMYDLEVACSTHNFILTNGIVTSNSHAACYGYMSYTTAYLKAHYPEEFMVSHLNVFLSSKKADKYEKVVSYEAEMQQMGMEFLPRSINKAEWDYVIYAKKDPAQKIFKSQLRPSIRCKGLSGRAAREILAHKPYKDMKELAFNTDPKAVDSKAIESLAFAGFFRDEKNKKRKAEDVVSEFNVLRSDMKKARTRGVESDDIFG